MVKEASFLISIGEDRLERLDALLAPEFRSRAALLTRFIDGFCRDPGGVMSGLIMVLPMPIPKPIRGTKFLYWLEIEDTNKFNAALESLYHRRQEVLDAFFAALFVDRAKTLKLIAPPQEPENPGD